MAAGIVLLIIVAMFNVGLGHAEDAPQPKRADDPPPIEQLLKSSPPAAPEGPVTVEVGPFRNHPVQISTCYTRTPACLERLAALSIYNQVRHCWDPPDRLKVSTDIQVIEPSFLRKGGMGGASTGLGKYTFISIGFELNMDGMLAAPPNATGYGPIGGPMATDIVRAIERCQPYKFAPGLSYPIWKDVVMNVRVEVGPDVNCRAWTRPLSRPASRLTNFDRICAATPIKSKHRRENGTKNQSRGRVTAAASLDTMSMLRRDGGLAPG
jgi:hypothetical protein